jgi:hypothetical protein
MASDLVIGVFFDGIENGGRRRPWGGASTRVGWLVMFVDL